MINPHNPSNNVSTTVRPQVCIRWQTASWYDASLLDTVKPYQILQKSVRPFDELFLSSRPTDMCCRNSLDIFIKDDIITLHSVENKQVDRTVIVLTQLQRAYYLARLRNVMPQKLVSWALYEIFNCIYRSRAS